MKNLIFPDFPMSIERNIKRRNFVKKLKPRKIFEIRHHQTTLVLLTSVILLMHLTVVVCIQSTIENMKT